jgi:hypothetical protein
MQSLAEIQREANQSMARSAARRLKEAQQANRHVIYLWMAVITILAATIAVAEVYL